MQHRTGRPGVEPGSAAQSTMAQMVCALPHGCIFFLSEEHKQVRESDSATVVERGERSCGQLRASELL